MTDIEELQHALWVLKKFNLPISPILEYAIKELIERLSFVSDHSESKPVVKVVKQREKIKIETKPTTGTKKKPTTLRVIRADGSILEYEKARQTLCQAIKEIGVEKVYSLNIPLDGMNLVTIGGNPQYSSQQYELEKGYYVNAHSCTSRKKRQLEIIFEALNLNWKVEIIEPE